MALALDTSRQFRSLSELAALIGAIVDASPTESEPDWLEWKSQADLADRKWQARIAKFIAGFANRDPAVAKLQAGGCGYLVIGAEPGSVVGVSPVDNAALLSGVLRYIRNTVRWSPQYVPHDGKQILVITVEPPESGDRPAAILRAYTDETGTVFREGDVFIRRIGKTELATQEDHDMLVERFAASKPQARNGITVEPLEALVAVAVADGAAAVQGWRDHQASVLLAPLGRQESEAFDSVLVRKLAGTFENRSSKQYRKDVEAYLDDATPLLPAKARADALEGCDPGMRLALVNETEDNFAAVQVEVVIDDDLWAYYEKADARPEMPGAPRLWGTNPLAEPLLGYNPGHLLGSMSGFYGPYIDNSGSARIVFQSVDLRPGTSMRLDPIYLVAGASLVGKTLVAEWTATSTSVSGIARGEIPIFVSEELVSPLTDALDS